MTSSKQRVLFARFNLDGHDRGIVTVISSCRDAGMEVIYIHYSDPRQIVKAAIEEDVDVIGITSSLGEHLRVGRELMAEMKRSASDIPVVFGGVIPTADVQKLIGGGVKRVFGPGSSPADAVTYISQLSKRPL